MNGSLAAHTLERTGLAMAGASCGLFVFSCIAQLNSGAYSYPSVMIATMAVGGLGFYLGIDLPRAGIPRRPGSLSAPSTVFLMSAIGTLLTGVASLTAVVVIIREITGSGDNRLLYSVAACWFAGAVLQICAGICASIQRARYRNLRAFTNAEPT